MVQAYDQGMIKVQMFHNGMWHGAVLKKVWYVPDASAHLFSVKAVAQNSYSTTLNKQGVVNRSGDGTVTASSKFIKDLYILAIRVLFHEKLQRSTWQRKRKHFEYGMNVLVIKTSAML
jgi:hypothetical protein